MDREFLTRELARFDAARPIQAAWTPPASWYVDPEFLELETHAVLRNSWQPVGRVDQAERPGEFFSGVFLGQPYVVVRDDQGELRAFHNVCAHHAARVVCGEGHLSEMVCPYHGWTYALDGRLRSAPRLGRVEDFCVGDFGLRPIPLATWGPFVFLFFNSAPRPLADDLEPFAAHVPVESVSRLKFFARREYTLRCNWKVYVDNYLDGGYHVAHLHRGLASQLDLGAYRTEVLPRLCVQSCAAGKGESSSVIDPLDFAERIGPGATYAWLYPNFMVNLYGPIMDTNWIVPLAVDRTLTVFDYYFAETEGPTAQQFIKRSMAASDQVQLEDVEICESVQIGLGSGAYDRGRYAPAVEIGEFHFHQWLREDMETYLQANDQCRSSNDEGSTKHEARSTESEIRNPK
jgi:choline monooxygenase